MSDKKRKEGLSSRGSVTAAHSKTINALRSYIPDNSLTYVSELLLQNPCSIKIVRKRSTKHGDFRRYRDGRTQITINNDLNPYRFLITLVHEIAHLVTFKRNKGVRPHGTEWKNNFRLLMLPLLNPDIFPEEVLKPLARAMIKPKASSDTDPGLSTALRRFDAPNDRTFIFELPENSLFSYKERTFVKREKRRTRYACIEVVSDKTYVFHPNAEVIPIKDSSNGSNE